MWDVLSLLWRAQTSLAPGAHKSPLWAVMLDRKKRIKEESGHRGSTKTRQRNQEAQTERPLSWFHSFMSDKHPVVWVALDACMGENSHKSIKGSHSSCPLYLINVCVCVCVCVLHGCDPKRFERRLATSSHKGEDVTLSYGCFHLEPLSLSAYRNVLLQFYGICVNYWCWANFSLV